ncbi:MULTISPECIES: pilus assembly protein [Thioclava]|uniref:Pilus assembly protein n=1 Tax=Thioclava kandeliae TaxID=3070818 RepID=A0ABV1SFR8_9RHOB
MRIFRRFKELTQRETGALTAEWVVLTAVVAVVALAVAKVVGQSTYTASTKIADYLESVEIQDDF